MTTNSHLYEQQQIAKTVPALQYTEGVDFAKWQAQCRQKLTELLGLPLQRCDAQFHIESERERTDCDCTEIRFTVQTEPGYYVPCYLLLPKSDKPCYPLTICLSGHGGGMHIAAGISKCEGDKKDLESWPHRAMGPRSVREGRCALIIEARNFGQSSLKGYGTSCTEAAKNALLLGRTVIGERVWDAMRILDAVLEQYPQIDQSNIVCTGNSGGGTATYYLACLEERITAAAPSCSVCTYEDSICAMEHCLCNHIPSIRRYFEMGDLAAMIAPRYLVVATGKQDPIFPLHGAQRTFAQIERIYAGAGAPQNCALVIGQGGHLNYADGIWEKLHAFGL